MPPASILVATRESNSRAFCVRGMYKLDQSFTRLWSSSKLLISILKFWKTVRFNKKNHAGIFQGCDVSKVAFDTIVNLEDHAIQIEMDRWVNCFQGGVGE